MVGEDKNSLFITGKMRAEVTAFRATADYSWNMR
jgi:hypothetical protein